MSQYLTVNKLQGIVEPKQGVFVIKGGFAVFLILQIVLFCKIFQAFKNNKLGLSWAKLKLS